MKDLGYGYIGMKFKRPNKDYIETVVDFHVTKNSRAETVNRKLVSTHEFAGQTVFNYEVPVSTVERYKLSTITK